MEPLFQIASFSASAQPSPPQAFQGTQLLPVIRSPHRSPPRSARAARPSRSSSRTRTRACAPTCRCTGRAPRTSARRSRALPLRFTPCRGRLQRAVGTGGVPRRAVSVYHESLRSGIRRRGELGEYRRHARPSSSPLRERGSSPRSRWAFATPPKKCCLGKGNQQE
jgi:hypothetical protein